MRRQHEFNLLSYRLCPSTHCRGSIQFTVTLPTVKYGLMSAAFVVFTLAITDFGAPKVVGGDYDVLATDIYNKVVGQQSFSMGATVSTLLLIPAMIAFVLDRLVQRRQVAQITADITPLGPKPHRPVVQTAAFIYCLLIAVFILSIYGIVIVGSFIKFWPYDTSLTLKNFTPHVAGAHHPIQVGPLELPGGFRILWNSLKMAGLTTIVGTVVVFFSAYLIEKSKELSWARAALYLLSIMPLAVPGMVLGVDPHNGTDRTRALLPVDPGRQAAHPGLDPAIKDYGYEFSLTGYAVTRR